MQHEGCYVGTDSVVDLHVPVLDEDESDFELANDVDG